MEIDAPHSKRHGRLVFRLVVIVMSLYVGLLPVLLALEEFFLFPGASVARARREPPAYLEVREATFDSSDGQRIHAWFSTPTGWEPRQGAILYSHGSGPNLSGLNGRVYRWRHHFGRAVLLYDYPGYGKSTGRPSEAGCYAAGEAALRWLVKEQRVPADEVILVGESLGGAIAVELATRHPARLLVLLGAFTSFPDMAQTRVPIYPSRYLVHTRMDNEAKIGLIRCPVLIAHGTADPIVPYWQAERLFAAAAEPRRLVRLEGHGHTPPTSADFFEEVKGFLAGRDR